MNKKRPSTDFLFAQPSMLSGQARLFDFSGSFDDYNSCDTPDEADAKAMYADWAVVGYTIESVIQQKPDSESEEKAA